MVSELPELTAFYDFRCVLVNEMVTTRSAGPTLSETAENMEHLALGSAGSSVEDVAVVASGSVGQIESAAPVRVAEAPVVGTAGSKERDPVVDPVIVAGADAGKKVKCFAFGVVLRLALVVLDLDLLPDLARLVLPAVLLLDPLLVLESVCSVLLLCSKGKHVVLLVKLLLLSRLLLIVQKLLLWGTLRP